MANKNGYKPLSYPTLQELEVLLCSKLSMKQKAEKLELSVQQIERRLKVFNLPRHGKIGKRRYYSSRKKIGSIVKCKNNSCSNMYYKLSKSLTHFYCSKKCMYSCQEYREKLKKVDRSYLCKEEYRAKLRKEHTNAFINYSRKVHTLTKFVYRENKQFINPNNYPRTLCGVRGGYQLDHILSIKNGFQLGLPAEELVVLANLRMLPWKENLLRNRT